MKSTVIDTSKEMIAFSDFPPPKDFPNYLHNIKVLEYFRQYAEHFGLIKHIKFNAEIVKCVKNDDYVINGKWKLTWMQK